MHNTSYVLFQECSKKQKNDDSQSSSVDALSSNDGFEEVMFLLKTVPRTSFCSCFVMRPKGRVPNRELPSAGYNAVSVMTLSICVHNMRIKNLFKR